ncbi:cation:proton antiporter domain-containing protein [Catenuloplanes indicus]|uniref:NhaP-type Na+/H+ or K+/H+ antiporter n=1 Tax=Catenuloplanes indicus TaxID=137267 RepID=A0AAE4AWK8_9ACTN|nr:cation:proton antiporter [Catenuloplanes indicus]MDQ0365132.1 NhaP-type Na+/H+ or K+/H+ antiporter [Catenuloplanes indicus]
MDRLHLFYATVGTCAAVLALVSRQLRRLPVREPLVALLAGVVLGPQLTGLVEIDDPVRDVLLLEGARLLLAASVMAAALRFPVTSWRPLTGRLVVLLLVVMPVAAAVAGAAALLLGVPVALAVLIGACLSPTDPVLAASVVTGEPAERDLPGRLRRLLTVESGANDGLALPLVALALAAALPDEGVAGVAGTLVWQVLAGTVIGVVAGAAAGCAIRAATGQHSLSRGPELVFTLLLAVAVLGVARLAGTDGVLAVFVTGAAYNRVVGDNVRGPQDSIDEAVNRYAVLPLFVLLGIVLPWHDWIAFGPAAVAFAAAVLLVRRLPVVLALARPLRLPLREAVFAGWFGPIGISALFYLTHSIDKGVQDPRVFAAGTLAIAVSVIAFGVSGTPLRKAYADSGSRDSE